MIHGIKAPKIHAQVDRNIVLNSKATKGYYLPKHSTLNAIFHYTCHVYILLGAKKGCNDWCTDIFGSIDYFLDPGNTKGDIWKWLRRLRKKQ